jgi:hypothetical protein
MLQEVLLQQVTQQGDNLHFVALAAAQVESDADVPELAKTLIQDLEVSCPSWRVVNVLTDLMHQADMAPGTFLIVMAAVCTSIRSLAPTRQYVLLCRSQTTF